MSLCIGNNLSDLNSQQLHNPKYGDKHPFDGSILSFSALADVHTSVTNASQPREAHRWKGLAGRRHTAATRNRL